MTQKWNLTNRRVLRKRTPSWETRFQKSAQTTKLYSRLWGKGSRTVRLTRNVKLEVLCCNKILLKSAISSLKTKRWQFRSMPQLHRNDNKINKAAYASHRRHFSSLCRLWTRVSAWSHKGPMQLSKIIWSSVVLPLLSCNKMRKIQCNSPSKHS